jgi:hypothetical protein
VSRVDRALPWVAGAATVAGVLITALSGVPARLPGIALDSSALFVAERGVAVIAVLIAAVTLVGRTLKRELPTGFSATTGSVMYAATIAEATTSSEAAAAELVEDLAKQRADISNLKNTVAELIDALGGPPGDERQTAERGGRGPNPGGRDPNPSARMRS